MIIEEAVEIRVADGVCDAMLFRDDGASPRPGVIHLTDIMGIRPASSGMAHRLAEQGYTVLMPNLFYRTGRPPMFDFVPQIGEERTMKRFGELTAPLTPDALERDARAYVDYLSAHVATKPGMMAAVGYCYSGGVAMRIAATCPDKIAAAASFHGGGLMTDAPHSPHLLLPRIKAQLYFGHAIEDRTMPADTIKKFEAALLAWGGRYESETYAGALHGWTVPQMPAYNEAQAERAFEKLKQLLTATLA